MGKIHEDITAFKTDRLFEFLQEYQIEYTPEKFDSINVIFRSYYAPLRITKGVNTISGVELEGVASNPAFIAFLRASTTKDLTPVVAPKTGDAPPSPQKLDIPEILTCEVIPEGDKVRLRVHLSVVHHAVSYKVEYSETGSTFEALRDQGTDTSFSNSLDVSSVLFVRAKAIGNGTDYIDSDYSELVEPTQPDVS